MTIEIRDVSVRCPTHKIPLVWIPKPIADDIVVCPDCGTGGRHEQVVEKGMGVRTENFIRIAPVKESSHAGGDDCTYALYYNEIRTHRSLNKNSPVSRPVQSIGRIVSHTLVGGLHHQYVRI